MVKLFCLISLLSGCSVSELSTQARSVTFAYPPMVKNCDFLGVAQGCSDVMLLEYGMQQARQTALEQAAEMGGTHIVWGKSSRYPKSFINAKIYKCKEKPCLHTTRCCID